PPPPGHLAGTPRRKGATTRFFRKQTSRPPGGKSWPGWPAGLTGAWRQAGGQRLPQKAQGRAERPSPLTPRNGSSTPLLDVTLCDYGIPWVARALLWRKPAPALCCLEQTALHALAAPVPLSG